MKSLGSPSGELGRLLRRFRGLFIGVAAISCVVNLLMLAPSLYMLQIYDRVLSSGSHATLLMLSLLVVGVYTFEALLGWVRSRALIRGSSALALATGERVFDASFARSRAGQPGATEQALSDLSTLRQFLTGSSVFALLDAPWAPVYLAVIYLLHPGLAALAAAAAVTLLILAWSNEKLTAPTLMKAGAQSAQARHFAGAQLRNAEAVQAMGLLRPLRERWLGQEMGVLRLQAEASDRAASIAAFTRFARLVAQSGMLGLGALLVLDGSISGGAMIAASLLLGRALAPVEQAMSAWRSVVSARSAYGRLSELLAEHPPSVIGTALPRPEGHIRVEGLVAGPPGTGTTVLRNLRFAAAAGTLVAVVGPSGCGKSTLARTLVGAWTPQAGTVRLDHADLHQWDKAEVGPWIGYLPQDVELFDGTVADNIGRFGPRDDAAVVAAARRAGVHEMILRLPRGYQTPLGPNGAALSGGQRQRIALARAMYGNVALLVLDEPDAHLDDAGSAALLAALQSLKDERRTVFVVTHRTRILELADSVLVLGGGTIQAYGPRAEIVRSLSSTTSQAGSPIRANAA